MYATFRVSTSSLSTDESMKTSLKWDQPRWTLSAFSCSLLSVKPVSEAPAGSATSSSGGDSEITSSFFSAQGGLITGLIRIRRPFTTPQVSSAVICSSLSLLSMRSTLEDKQDLWWAQNSHVVMITLGFFPQQLQFAQSDMNANPIESAKQSSFCSPLTASDAENDSTVH